MATKVTSKLRVMMSCLVSVSSYFSSSFIQRSIETGGVSTFSKLDKKWKFPFILKSSATISDNLTAVNDHGNHYSIEPTHRMPKSEYDGYIKELNSIAKLVTAAATDAGEELHGLDTLPSPARVSTHPSKSVRFMTSALAAVYHDRPQISDWDENDYTYIGVIAAEISTGNLPLDSLRWQGAGHETTKAQRFVAQALVSHMKAERDAAPQRALEDDEDIDDVYAELDNDHALLRSILELDDEANPLSKWF